MCAISEAQFAEICAFDLSVQMIVHREKHSFLKSVQAAQKVCIEQIAKRGTSDHLIPREATVAGHACGPGAVWCGGSPPCLVDLAVHTIRPGGHAGAEQCCVGPSARGQRGRCGWRPQGACRRVQE